MHIVSHWPSYIRREINIQPYEQVVTFFIKTRQDKANFQVSITGPAMNGDVQLDRPCSSTSHPPWMDLRRYLSLLVSQGEVEGETLAAQVEVDPELLQLLIGGHQQLQHVHSLKQQTNVEVNQPNIPWDTSTLCTHTFPRFKLSNLAEIVVFHQGCILRVLWFRFIETNLVSIQKSL